MSRMVSFFVLIAIIVVIGFLFFRVMAPFLLPLFLAALLVVIFQPLHRRVLHKFKGHQRWAALTTTLAVLVIVLLPLLLATFMAVAEGSAVIARLDPAEFRQKVGRARDRFSLLRMPQAQQIRDIESSFSTLISAAPDSGSPGFALLQIADLIQKLDKLRTEFKFTTEETSSKFEAINATLSAALNKDGDENLDKTPNEDQDQPEAIRYVDTLRSASSQFHDLKLDLLGGPFRTWIKELANPTEENVQQFIRKFLEDTRGALFSLGGRTTAMIGRIAIGLVIMVVAMFFFLAEGGRMVTTLMRLSPLDDRYEKELLSDFTSVSRAVVVATLLSALAQALLAGFGFFLTGFESITLMMLLTGLLAMIPFVGAAAVWVPACIWLYFFEERVGAAILLTIYGLAVISTVDNVIKPLVLHGRSRLHPLLALLSVLGGMNALGPIGILVGPMLVAFLQTLLNILHRELTQFELERSTRLARDPK